jgi:hypothetical protein
VEDFRRYLRFVVPLTFNLAGFFGLARLIFTCFFATPTTLSLSEDESESLDEEDDELDEEELLLLDEEEEELLLELVLVVLSESLLCSISSRLNASSFCCGAATFFLALSTILLLFVGLLGVFVVGVAPNEFGSSLSFFVADFFIARDESFIFNSFSAVTAYLSVCSTLGTDTGDSLNTAGRLVASSWPEVPNSIVLLSADGDAFKRLRALARISCALLWICGLDDFPSSAAVTTSLTLGESFPARGEQVILNLSFFIPVGVGGSFADGKDPEEAVLGNLMWM